MCTLHTCIEDEQEDAVHGGANVDDDQPVADGIVGLILDSNNRSPYDGDWRGTEVAENSFRVTPHPMRASANRGVESSIKRYPAALTVTPR
jgi:hypothetical protein